MVDQITLTISAYGREGLAAALAALRHDPAVAEVVVQPAPVDDVPIGSNVRPIRPSLRAPAS